MRSFILTFTLILAASRGLCAQSAQPTVAAVTPDEAHASVSNGPVLSDRAPRYRLRKGDSFELQFAFSPEFDQTVTIEPDGYIALKSAASIHAEGLTVPELSANIVQAYKGILHDPVVTIDLKEFEKPYFLAAGQVGKPGKYELRSDLTVTEGVAIAGGFTESSRHSQVVLFRPSNDGMTVARVIDVKKMLKSKNLAEDIHLQPGDMIFVPQSRISKIQRYLPTSSLGLYGYPTSF